MFVGHQGSCQRSYTGTELFRLGCIGWIMPVLNVCNHGARFHPQPTPQLAERSRARDQCAQHTATAGREHSFCLLRHRAESHAKTRGLEGQQLVSETGTSPLEMRVIHVFLRIFWRSIQLHSTHSLLHWLNLALHKLPSARCP